MVEKNYLNDSHSSEKYAKYVMKSDPYSQSNNNGTMMQNAKRVGSIKTQGSKKKSPNKIEQSPTSIQRNFKI